MVSHVLAELGTGEGILAGTLIVSATALIYGLKGGRISTLSQIEEAMSDRIDDLVRQNTELASRVTEIERDFTDCTKARSRLERENWRLLRKIEGLENGTDH